MRRATSGDETRVEGRIVVGTDLTFASNDAIQEADARAARDGARLIVAHVAPGQPWYELQEPESWTLDGPDPAHALRQAVEAQVTRLTGRDRTAFDVVIERGLPCEALVRIADARGALLVVGSHAEASLTHAVLGDVAERAVAHAHGPVLVARRGTGLRGVVAATDTSATSLLVLDAAVEEARRSRARLTVVHCVTPRYAALVDARRATASAHGPDSREWGELAAYARCELRGALRRRHIDAALRVFEGRFRDVLFEITERTHPACVVMGASQHATLSGNVTAAAVRSARCSVLVIRPPVS